MSIDDHRGDEHEIEEDDADDLESQHEQRDRGEELLGLVVVEDADDLGLDARSIDLLGDGLEGGAEANCGETGFVGDEGRALDLGVDLQSGAELGHVAGHRVDQGGLGGKEGECVGLLDRHVEVIAADAPVALGVVDRPNQTDDADADRLGVVAPGGVDVAGFAEAESARGGCVGSDGDVDDWGLIRCGSGGGGGPLTIDQLDVVAHALEPEDARAVAGVFIGRDSADLGHEEGGGGERLFDVGDVIAGNAQPAVDGVERLLGQTAGEAVGGVEDADIEVGVGDAAQVGLQAEVLQGVAIDRGRGHQGDGEDDADADGGHQASNCR